MADLSFDQTQQSKFGKTTLRIILYVLLTLFALYYLLPLFVMVTTSLKSLEEIRTGSLIALPREITFDAWKIAWASACTGIQCEGLRPYFWNSVLLAVPAVLLSTLLGALNGYVVAQWRFRGANLIFSLMLFGCFIPFQVVLLPMARLLGLMGIAGTIPGLIFVHVIYGIGFTTLFFRNYYVTIPSELVKAAKVDGANFFTDLLVNLPTLITPHHRGHSDLAIYSNLERLPIWGVFQSSRNTTRYCCAEQHRKFNHRRKRVQCRHGCSDNSCPADAVSLCRRR